jgi:hypothetical protein
VKWAKRCPEVGNSQFELVRGGREADADMGDVVDDYDLVIVTDRYFESLVRRRGKEGRGGRRAIVSASRCGGSTRLGAW